MKFRLSILVASLAIAGALANTLAYAADEAGKPTSTSLAPAGQGPGAQGSAPSTMSDKSRSTVKMQTKDANKMGGLAPAGQTPQPVGQTSSNQDADKSMMSKSSTKSRSAVKAETKADAKAGALQPAGQATQPVDTPPKK